MSREPDRFRRDGVFILWCPARLRRLFDRCVAGETRQALADEAGVNQEVLRAQWWERGWSVRTERDRQRHERALEAWNEHRTMGTSTEELAARMGLTAGGLRHHWRKAGHKPLKNKHRLSNTQARRAYILRQNGASIADVCRALGLEPHPWVVRGVGERIQHYQNELTRGNR